jgi:hypothetical protein
MCLNIIYGIKSISDLIYSESQISSSLASMHTFQLATQSFDMPLVVVGNFFCPDELVSSAPDQECVISPRNLVPLSRKGM